DAGRPPREHEPARPGRCPRRRSRTARWRPRRVRARIATRLRRLEPCDDLAVAASLRGQPLDHPAAAFPAVADPVVPAVGRSLPERGLGGQHPEAAPALRTGNTGSATVTPQLVLDLPFQNRPAGHDAALMPGGRGEAGGGGARAPELVRFVLADPL